MGQVPVALTLRQIVEAMKRDTAHFLASLDDAVDYLLKNLRSNDILLVLSAGDADQISARVLADLKE